MGKAAGEILPPMAPGRGLCMKNKISPTFAAVKTTTIVIMARNTFTRTDIIFSSLRLLVITSVVMQRGGPIESLFWFPHDIYKLFCNHVISPILNNIKSQILDTS
jgi:hypothetical protein